MNQELPSLEIKGFALAQTEACSIFLMKEAATALWKCGERRAYLPFPKNFFCYLIFWLKKKLII